MSYDSIIHRINVIGFSNPNDVHIEFRYLYENSTLLEAALNSWLNNNPTSNITITFAQDTAEVHQLNSGNIFIDIDYFSDNYYISKTGQAVRDDFRSGLAHEIGHAITTNADYDSFSDLAGANINNVNTWYAELGIPEQATYQAYEKNLNVLTPGRDYTNGEEIENAIIDRGPYYNNITGFGFDSGNIDLLDEGVIGKSLIIGGSSSNNYGGTASADYIYGEGGDDILLGHGGADYIEGGAGNDVLNGGGGWDHLKGGEGDDWLFAGEGDDFFSIFDVNQLDGGAGDDVLVAGGFATLMAGGSGKDFFHIGSNAIVTDGSSDDQIFMAGIPIVGGTKQWWMEGNTAYWAPFSTLMTAFPVIGSSILSAAAFFVDSVTMKFASFKSYEDGSLGINIGYGLGGVAKIENYSLDLDSGAASAGVVAFEASRGGRASAEEDSNKQDLLQFINLALKAGFGVGFQGWDPIVLDLDGDGYELTTLANSAVYFEFDGDGFAEQSGWVRPDDGFLVLDANSNGIVDDSTEFFGDETQTGFAELATHDGNADGVIDANDAVFSQLQVWRDLDGDGETDAGELFSLAALNIASISLTTSTPETGEIGGNLITAEGAVTLTDGTTINAGDVVLDISQVSTEYLGATTVSSAAAALPELRGFGTVADLRIAMSEDAGLLAQVQAFDALTTTDLSVLKADAEAILYAWADVDGVTADPIGSGGFDARKLAFLEEFAGQEIAPRDPQTGDVLTDNVDELETLWADTLESLTLSLVVQASGLSQFSGLNYDEGRDLILIDGAGGLADTYSAILSGLSSTPATALAEWDEWGELLRALHDGARRFDNNLVRDDFAAAQLETAIIDSGSPLTLAELAPALGIDNLTIGTAAAETLTQNGGGTIFSDIGDGDTVDGGSGQDVYLLKSGFGDVIIDDVEGGVSGDRIRFIDVNKDGVSAERIGDDLVITVTATGDTVTVLGQFADVVPLAADVVLSDNRGIEEIQFADGGLMELPDIAIAVGEGTAGNDVMEGTMHTDVFQGRAGNDTLKGGDDGDLYVFDAGDGSDTIIDNQSNPLLSAADMLIFGDGIAPDDITFSRAPGNSSDLLITIGSSGDSILVDGQFSYGSLGYNHIWSPNSRIELFAFRHYGDSYSSKDIQQKIIEAETTDGNDVTTGFGDDDLFYASAGDDLMIGRDGADTYFWGSGFGNDSIDEQSSYIDVDVGLGGLSLEHGADTVVFAPDIDPADVVFSRLSVDPHLTITLESTGETLTVLNQFSSFQTGVLGAQWMDRVEWFEFADGTRLSWQDILVDVTTGTDGDDSLWGDLTADTLTGGKGDDYMSGRGTGDRYVYEFGDGNDIIHDNSNSLLGVGFVSVDSTPDTVSLGTGITEDFLSFSASGTDLIITIDDPNDPHDIASTITLQSQNSFIQTGVFGAFGKSRIEQLEYDDGSGGRTTLTADELNQRVIAENTTSGNDVAEGFALSDRFGASAGDDIVRGGNSGDVYEFGFGAGNDRIEESVSNVLYGDYDAVEFGAGIALANLDFARNSNDLIINLLDGSGVATGDSLTIAGQWSYNNWFTWRDIEVFRFEDGSELTKSDVLTILLQSTPGDDHLVGTAGSEVLNGGPGDDILDAGKASDTYEFSYGDGNDVIREPVHNDAGGNDKIVFDDTVTRSDLSFQREDNDLVILIDGGVGGSITVEGQFTQHNWEVWRAIETIEFLDSSSAVVDSMSYQDIVDVLTTGGAGDDYLKGSIFNDTLHGGPGNDTLVGADGSDTYLFNLGDGDDVIIEGESYVLNPHFDTLHFGTGIFFDDLTFERSGTDLVITHSGGDRVTLVSQFSFGTTDKSVDQITFAEATETTLTDTDLRQMFMKGTAGDDVIVGYGTADIIEGGYGDDELWGEDGADTYVFNIGDGVDTIYEDVDNANYSENDTVQFGENIAWEDLIFARDGNELQISIAGTQDKIIIPKEWSTINNTSTTTWWDVENFTFADGTAKTKTDIQIALLQSTDGDDNLLGFYTSDTLEGGLGNDILDGGRGGDVFVHNIGDGHDTIADFAYYWGSSGDTLLFGAGIDPSDVVVSRPEPGAEDMLLSVNGGESSVTLKNQIFGGREWTLDYVEFADGTIWDSTDLAVMMTAAETTAGDDLISGTTFDDLLIGGAGNDNLIGHSGADILEGGTGDDLLEGGEDNDTYIYNSGDGHDVISDYRYYWSNGNDELIFGAGIAPSDITVTRSTTTPTDMILEISGGTGSVTLTGQLTGHRSWKIETVEFADGTIWNDDHLLSLLPSIEGTAAGETLTGTALDEIINAHGGNDTVNAKDGDDIITGGPGDDQLNGGKGADTYFYYLGDGDDVVHDYYGTRTNALVFGEGIAPGDLLFASMSDFDDVLISFNGTAGSIKLENQWWGDAGIEEVRFDDGTIWDEATLAAEYVLGQQTSGDDTIKASNAADIVDGGAGNDTIYTGYGDDVITGGLGDDQLEGARDSDTYIYNLGDGDDIVYDYRGSRDNVLELGAGIAPGDLLFASMSDFDDVLISFNGTAGSIKLENQWWSDAGIEEVRFADGTVWDETQLAAAYVLGQQTSGDDTIKGSHAVDLIDGGAGNDTITAGNGDDIIIGGAGDDTVTGGNGNDTITGGLGDDTLHGSDGSDTYVFNAGDGSMLIDDNGNHDTDRLLIHGYDPTVTTVMHGPSGSDAVILTFAGSNDAITIWNTLDGSKHDQIEQVVFDDGTIWTPSDLQNMAVPYATTGDDQIDGTEGNDTLNGLAGNDTIMALGGDDQLTGGLGNDQLEGGVGADTYIFNTGDGQDVIEETADVDFDTLHFGAGILKSDLDITRNGDDVDIALPNGDKITLMWQIWIGSGDWAIDQITFAEAGETAMSKFDIEQATLKPTAGADTLVGGEENNIIYAAAGDDLLQGDVGDDTLAGEAGNDRMEGGDGADTYLFNLGDGEDVIEESESAGYDVIQMGSGIFRNDLTFSQSGDSLIITLPDASEIEVLWQFWTGSGDWSIEEISFSEAGEASYSKADIELIVSGQSGQSAAMMSLPSFDQSATSADDMFVVRQTDSGLIYLDGYDDLFWPAETPQSLQIVSFEGNDSVMTATVLPEAPALDSAEMTEIAPVAGIANSSEGADAIYLRELSEDSANEITFSVDRSAMILSYERPIGRAPTDFDMPVLADDDIQDFGSVGKQAFEDQGAESGPDFALDMAFDAGEAAISFQETFV
ncbi:calcium-binding protein [Parasphingopyxis sp.]|uniref:calcium-binding protein n=1 Tax=Parasphingopyxis sp. TaxID=1920299 RepID=UPI002612C38E|nr:calcium-binding protein [Parasphingopyxis sp.]